MCVCMRCVRRAGYIHTREKLPKTRVVSGTNLGAINESRNRDRLVRIKPVITACMYVLCSVSVCQGEGRLRSRESQRRKKPPARCERGKNKCLKIDDPK